MLVEPVTDAEVVARVAGRRAHQGRCSEELVAQGERLETMLREDPLTGLSNRRCVLTQLGGHGQRRPPPRAPAVGRDVRPRPLQAHQRRPRPRGRRRGCSSAVAHAMREHLRAEDELGRLGGEEFLVLLPDTDAARPRRVAERLRAEVAAGRGGPVPVTVSVGLATWDGEAPRSCSTAPTRRSTRRRRRARRVRAPSWLLACTAAHDHDCRGKARDHPRSSARTRTTPGRPRSRSRCSRTASTTSPSTCASTSTTITRAAAC